jgi:hypothetical protein
MDDALLMGGFKGLGDLSCDGQRFIDRDRPLCDAIGERRPLDQLHHEGLDALDLLETVDDGDVRMVQRGEGSCLTSEASQPFLVLCYSFRQNLDGDVSPEVRVRGAIHFAHASDANLGGDFVRTYASTGGQGHADSA